MTLNDKTFHTALAEMAAVRQLNKKRARHCLLWIAFYAPATGITALYGWASDSRGNYLVGVAYAGIAAANAFFYFVYRRRVRRLDCAIKNFQQMYEKRFSASAIEHHFDQGMAALERM